MSLTKRWIEEQMDWGYDVLHIESQHMSDESQHTNAERQYEEWCHSSDTPTPKIEESK